MGMKGRFVIQDTPQSLSSLQELGQALLKETGEQMLNLIWSCLKGNFGSLDIWRAGKHFHLK